MAHLLRLNGLLLILAFPPLVAQDSTSRSANLKFSHRLHLVEAEATCLNCHNLVTNSSSAEDNNLPSEEACLSCHDGEKAGNECTLCHVDPQRGQTFESPQRLFHFDHEFHLLLGNFAPLLAAVIDGGSYLGTLENIRSYLNTDNACEACHRALHEVDFSGPANLPQMADCLVCHNQIDPPFSCKLCHLPGSSILPATHTSNYIDLHSSVGFEFDRDSCAICHGTNFTCMGCH